MPTNEELLSMLTEKKMSSNIAKKKARIKKYEKGINVLRSSCMPDDPFTQGRINYLAELIEDDKEAISNWTKLLDVASH